MEGDLGRQVPALIAVFELAGLWVERDYFQYWAGMRKALSAAVRTPGAGRDQALILE
jgi:hypothetical protein